MARQPTLLDWLEDPNELVGRPLAPPVIVRPPARVIEPDEVEPGPHHPWRGAYEGLHVRARQMLRRYRCETGARGVFAADVAAFANWSVGLRIDCVRTSWRSYAHWALAVIEALPATSEADRNRARAILREEPGAATDQETAERTAHAMERAECTRLRRNFYRRQKRRRRRARD